VFIIGIDPHKGSHTAAVLDRTESVIGELRVVADQRPRERLVWFAANFTPGTWATESASGLGALLAQQLVAAGETVLDVPPTLSARVRLLDAGCTDKTDPHDARAAAIVALRHSRLRRVTPVDHTAVLRLLADRHHDLTGLRTQAICRLHGLLCGLTPGGAGRLLSTRQAGRILHGVRPAGPVEIERKRIALELAGDVRRFDNQLVAVKERIVEAAVASATTLTDIDGIGPLGAAIIMGHTGDIDRFPTSGHSARYTGTAPIAASSGPKQRHRLNPRGNRQLNRALHVAAVTQVPNDTPGRSYYSRKLDEGKSPKQALRARAPDRQDRLPAPGRRRSLLNNGEPGRATGTTRNPA
jgi:transposase